MAGAFICYSGCQWRGCIGACRSPIRPTYDGSAACNGGSTCIAAWLGWFDRRSAIQTRRGGKMPNGISVCRRSALSSIEKIAPASTLTPRTAGGAPADVLELRVIGAGRHAGDPQALVGIDGAVLVVLALIGTEVVVPAGARRFRDRVSRQFQNRVGRPSAIASDAITASARTMAESWHGGHDFSFRLTEPITHRRNRIGPQPSLTGNAPASLSKRAHRVFRRSATSPHNRVTTQ